MEKRINKSIYIAILLFACIACNSNKKRDTIIAIDSIQSDLDENLNESSITLPIHGEINQENLTKYYPNLTDTIKSLGIINSEKIDINIENGIIVSLLHNNTGTFDQIILCIHNKNFVLIDKLYIGKATDFDNGKSQTIEYSVTNNNQIVFNKVHWGYVNNEEEIDTVSYEKLNIIISDKGITNAIKTNEISIQNLQTSFTAKNEVQFLNQFPTNFKQFNDYFGWDKDKDEPKELYEECYGYIDYLFDLLNKKEHKEYEKNIIGICTNGIWIPDGVNYFQDKSLNYIKEKKRYHLINELTDKEAKSVLFFLFDSPHPKIDNDFGANLNIEKKKIFDQLFETGFFDLNENDDEDLQMDVDISSYANNDSYFVKDIDINNDHILDKIVSSKPYEGEELLLFINNNNSYEFSLTTSNFSEDGGNQIKDLKKDENGFVIITSFPDRGFFESHYYISFSNDHWILTKTIYKTDTYVCDIKQEIDIGDANLLKNLKLMPDESEREKVCIKVK